MISVKYIDKIGNVITYILIGLVSFVAVFMVYSYICLNLLGKDYVSILGYTYFEVASGSMEPAISKDDLVIVKIGSDYKERDIVTFYLNNEFITHRVVQIDSKTITTKGDYNNSRDAKVRKDNVLGKVVMIVPKFGIWKRVLMTPKVFSLLFVTLVLFSFTFSYNNRSKRKRIKQKILKKQKEDLFDLGDIPIKKK